MLYGFNSLFLDDAALEEMHTFLEKQQDEARIYITGYSDGKGTETAKQDVSRKTAAFVEWYIKHKLSHKGFTAFTDHKVMKEEGEAYRKVELRVD